MMTWPAGPITITQLSQSHPINDLTSWPNPTPYDFLTSWPNPIPICQLTQRPNPTNMTPSAQWWMAKTHRLVQILFTFNKAPIYLNFWRPRPKFLHPILAQLPPDYPLFATFMTSCSLSGFDYPSLGPLPNRPHSHRVALISSCSSLSFYILRAMSHNPQVWPYFSQAY